MTQIKRMPADTQSALTCSIRVICVAIPPYVPCLNWRMNDGTRSS